MRCWCQLSFTTPLQHIEGQLMHWLCQNQLVEFDLRVEGTGSSGAKFFEMSEIWQGVNCLQILNIIL